MIAYAFIGGGNMGGALIHALLQRGVAPPEALLVVDPVAPVRERFAALGCAVAERFDARVCEAQTLIFAVKPQQAESICLALAEALRTSSLPAIVSTQARQAVKPTMGAPAGPIDRVDRRPVALSIMAGIKLSHLRGWLKEFVWVRAMPNTPARVAACMSVYYAPPTLSRERIAPVLALLEAAGRSLRVDEEDLLDAATAISGSGPAYVFYLAEHWCAEAQALGFAAQEATQIVRQTLRGAIGLWEAETERTVKDLGREVSSPGGTTEAALRSFTAHGLDRCLREGIRAAHTRALELADAATKGAGSRSTF